MLGKLVIANALMTAAFCLLPAPSAPAWSNGVDGADAYGTHDWILDQALSALGDRAGWVCRRAAFRATDAPDTVDGIDHASGTWWHVWDQRCRW